MDKQEAIEKLTNIANGTGWVTYKSACNIVEQIHEPQKVVIPKFVAEWIEYYKDRRNTLYFALIPTRMSKELNEWMALGNNDDIFVRAWLDGYEVEKEKIYIIPLEGLVTTDGHQQYLTGKVGRYFASRRNSSLKQTFTQTELDNNVPACYREWAKPVEVE